MSILNAWLPENWSNWLLHVWYEDFVGVFLTGFIVTLLLPLIVAGCFLIVFFKRPKAFGVAKLFWRPTWWGRFVAGLGMGALLWQVVLAGYLFEPLATNFTQDRPPFCEIQPPVGTERDYSPNLNSQFPKKEPFPDNPELRFEPASIGTVTRYWAALMLGALVGIPAFVFAMTAGLAALGIFTRIWSALTRPPQAGAPATSPAAAPALAAGTPNDCAAPAAKWASPWDLLSNAAKWLALPLGIAASFVGTAGIASALWNVESLKGASAGTGQWLVWQAGWGKAEARQEFLQRKLGMNEQFGPLEPEQKGMTANQYYEAWFWEESYDKRLGTVNRLRPYFPVFGAFALSFAVIVVAYLLYFTVTAGLTFTPASGILFLLQVLLASHILMSYFVATPHLANLGLLFLMVSSVVAYKLRFRGISVPGKDSPLRYDLYGSPIKLTTYPRPVGNLLLEPEHVAFRDKGLAAAGATPPKRPMAILCVSGGGSRAAAWTMKMLTELETAFGRETIAFPYDIRLVTGASGGMIAGSYYVAGLEAPDPNSPGKVQRVDSLRVAALAMALRNGASIEERTAVERATKALETKRAAKLAAGAAPDSEKPAALETLKNANGELHAAIAEAEKLVKRDEATMDALFNAAIREDFLTPIARKIAFWDLASLFVPTVVREDRGTALERAWETALHGVMETTFEELKPGEKDGWRPSLIVTPMTVEDGRQLFITNLNMADVTENRANVLRGDSADEPIKDRDLLSREGWGFFRLFPEAHGSFRVGTAARMSASFPFILPAVELPTDPPLRVVDAGYYDNFGVGVAAEWLFANAGWVKENCSGVAVIQIRDGLSEESRRVQSKGLAGRPGPSRLARGFQWLTTPVEGLYNFRSQATAYRNDNLLHLLTRAFAGPDFGKDFFQTVAFELKCGDDISLNFTLTDDEKENIDRAANDSLIAERVQALIRWWKSRLP